MKHKPAWLDNKVATVFGVLFFPFLVIFAYRLNYYALHGEVMSGGRVYWRNLGWSLLCGIPFVGLIYGLVKLNDIVDTRNQLYAKLNK